MTSEEILTIAAGGTDFSTGPTDTSRSYRYRWAALASLDAGDVDRAQVYAMLAQAVATSELELKAVIYND
jgi:hypothetical protein